MNKGDNEHYLIFVNAADDAGAFPASRLQSITCKTDSTLLLKFSPGSLGDGQAASVDVVTLAITANKEKDVMIGIADAINNATKYPKNTKNYTVICDDVNSVFAHANILSCTITLDS